MNNLIRVSDPRLPIAKQTAYNWNNSKKYPQLLYKVAGVLIFDMAEWEDMAKAAKKENSAG